jgi:deoxyribodipyrimidine photo-lyase
VNSASAAADAADAAAAAPAPARPDGPSLVWLRDDLRLGDNPALTAAVERGRPIALVYLLDEVSPGIRPLGGAAHWWLHQSLTSLAADAAALGARLVLRRGAAEPLIGELVDELGAGAVFWNRRYGAAEREVDTAIKTRLTAAGVIAHSFAGSLLFEPWTIRTGGGTPYTVFTPFWRACTAGPPPR